MARRAGVPSGVSASFAAARQSPADREIAHYHECSADAECRSDRGGTNRLSAPRALLRGTGSCRSTPCARMGRLRSIRANLTCAALRRPFRAACGISGCSSMDASRGTNDED